MAKNNKFKIDFSNGEAAMHVTGSCIYLPDFEVLLECGYTKIKSDTVKKIAYNRTYENAVCIRVVDASDGMTASFSRLPYDLLENCSRRIINEVSGINRVVYDISSKPPATIEWE